VCSRHVCAALLKPHVATLQSVQRSMLRSLRRGTLHRRGPVQRGTLHRCGPVQRDTLHRCEGCNAARYTAADRCNAARCTGAKGATRHVAPLQLVASAVERFLAQQCNSDGERGAALHLQATVAL
jgi:hypothetical protein